MKNTVTHVRAPRWRALAVSAFVVVASFTSSLPAQRPMENLNRGVVAIRSSASEAFVSWRLLGLDPAGIGFNVYRSANGGAPVKLNGSVLTSGTNFTDTSANFSQSNVYSVRAVVGGVEQPAGGAYTLVANAEQAPVVRVPLRAPGNYNTKFVWVGDLDGDGEYEFVIDRVSTMDPAEPQRIEAYKRDGTFLWDVNMGPNSTNTYNIEPGSSTISVGHYDGVTVYDLDMDGRAEVIVRTANGVRFGDGATLSNSNDNLQFISVLNGQTGAERARIQIPTDYLADGPLPARLGIGYLDGTRPSVVAYLKNRVGSGGFQLMFCAYDFNGTALTHKWKWLRGNQAAPDGHNTRVADVDQNGTDEVCEVAFVLNGNGTLRYSLESRHGIIHGDRFHIGKFDRTRAGLQFYGIQQSNSSGLYDFYVDARDGALIWRHDFGVTDVGRGMAADIDPRYAGYEVWAFLGVYNAPGNVKTSDSRPYPNLGVWWDGDVLGENLNDGKIENWNYADSTVSRQLTMWQLDGYSSNVHPLFYGDIFGDWREEVVMLSAARDSLTIFTTPIPTATRIYTLAHNPAYRNCMTFKGYYQANQVDFYLGDGMSTPPVPNIAYANARGTVQAENVTTGGGVTTDSDRTGFNGRGFLNFPANGGFAQLGNAYSGSAGAKTLTIRYANGAASPRTGRVIVNGVAQNVTFPNSGGWTTWSTLNVTANLNAGWTNTIRLESTGQDLANIDEIAVP